MNKENYTILHSSGKTLPEPKKEPRVNKIVIFVVVAVSLLMTTVDTTIVATALETLQHELNTSVNWIGWTITAYSFGFVLMLPLSAKLAVLFGPRKVFVASVSVFTLASLLCGLSGGIELLIILRVIQALGAAGITPSVTAIIVDHFGAARDRAVGLFGSIFPIGVMIGPVFGGLIVTYWTWPWIFFVNVPLGLMVIVMSLIYIPKDKKPVLQPQSSMDTKGMIWLGMGLLAAMFALTYLGEENTRILSPEFAGLLALTSIGFTGFIRHINRKKQPFIKPVFVYGKAFGSVNFINLLYTGLTQGVIALVPLYAANRYGINALNASVLLISQGIASVILSTLMSVRLRKTGYRLPLYVGSMMIITGTALLSFAPFFPIYPYYWMMLATFIIGCGMGTISPAARNAGLQLVPEESATLAALRSLCIQLGTIICIATATAFIAVAAFPGETQSYFYLGLAAFLLLFIPVVSKVPEHKGSW